MIEGRPILFAHLVCGKCGKTFRANVSTVVCFLSKPFCLACLIEVNNLRARLGANKWGIPKNTYADEIVK